MADEKQVSALMRRHDQLKRWEESDTAKEAGVPKAKSRKVQFQDGCVFLAACSSSDTEEVKRLLERGADINTANVDGLTALHQACIDDNLEMVEFLVANGADVNVCDNEGWTPLHATASCGFTEIARYLIKEGADIAAVNNDGDLPIDICEDEEKMENLLQEEMDKQGIDADAARRNEEERMLMDANQWLNSRVVKEKKHHKSGATALHVAAAKGYIKVMNILLQAGVDINAEDNDGWTPLHAAAHWGQNEACALLVEQMCDMEKKDHAGLTPFDIADTDMVSVLEELKKKQIQLKTKAAEMDQEIIQTKGQTGKRRSSVTRMSGDQKQNVLHRSTEQERPPFEVNLFHNKDEEKKVESYNEEAEAEETGKEIERKNELNKQTSLVEKPWDQDFTHSHAGVDLKRTEMPKIDEVSESENISRSEETVKNGEQNAIVTKTEDESPAVIKDTPTTEPSNRELFNSVKDNNKTSSKDLVSRSISAPPGLPTEEQGWTNSVHHTSLLRDDSIHSWRAGLRKMGSMNVVNDCKNQPKEDDKFDKPAPNHFTHVIDHDHYGNQRNIVSTSSVPTCTADVNQDNRLADRHSFVSTYGRSATSPYRSLQSSTGSGSYQSAYVPYYRRQQEQNERKDLSKDSDRPQDDVVLRARTTAPSTATTVTATITVPTSITTASTTIYTTTTVTSPTSNISMFRRSYEPPKRDEEAETQRKARAKRARETRRSTQGVALEDVEQAQESIKHSSTDQDREKLRLQNNRETDRDNSSVSITKRDPVRDSQKDFVSDRTSSNLSSKDSPADDTSTYHRRWEDHRDDDSRSSFRRSRDSTRDTLGSHTSDSISSYIPRSQRNALTSSDSTNTSSLTAGSTGLSRTSSLRSRIRNGELDDTRNELSHAKEHKTDKDTKEDLTLNKDESKKDGHEEKKELSLVRARRARRERRSTGIVSYDPENDEDKEGKENKPEESNKEDQTDSGSLGSRYGSGRYSSAADRPSSYSEYSRSTPALDTDYKKMYEDERLTNEKLRKELDQVKRTEESETKRLRKELEQTKRELREAKAELDKIMKRSELARDSSDKREKRAMERKLSELEEELKHMAKIKADNAKLKEENRALTRVVAKLSK